MKIHTPLLALLLPTLLTVNTNAQDEPAARQQFVLPAGETSIQDLVDHCATYLGCNILTTANECAQAQPIRLQKAIATDATGCKDLLTGLLYRSGFALTVVDDRHDLFEVIFMAGPRGREVMNRAQEKSVTDILARPSLKVPVTTVVKLENINAQLANNALRPFFASAGGSRSMLTIGNVGSASSLLLSGMQDQVAQAIRMIQRCDVKQPEQPQTSRKLSTKIAKLEARIQSLEKQLERVGKGNVR